MMTNVATRNVSGRPVHLAEAAENLENQSAVFEALPEERVVTGKLPRIQAPCLTGVIL
jgi:hypothetical protein